MRATLGLAGVFRLARVWVRFRVRVRVKLVVEP